MSNIAITANPYFERLDLSLSDWGERLKAFPDRTVYHTPAWLSFVIESKKVEPVFAALRRGSETLGYFTGMLLRKSGFKILGSPFPGWSTPYLGFNLLPGVSRRAALEALPRFAFKELGCAHFEMGDRYLTPQDIEGLGFEHWIYTTAVVDLTSSEEEIFSRMTNDCRNSIRKAQKSGVVVEETQDEGFAEEYYRQLEEVFARQGLVPTFDLERVRQLIRHLQPAGELLMLRARDREGTCIATGVFVMTDQEIHLWGAASWYKYQSLRPNDAIQWYAMKYGKSHGALFYDPGGKAHFKSKFGGTIHSIVMIRKSRYPLVTGMRNFAKKLVKTRQRLMGGVRRWRAGQWRSVDAHLYRAT
jgi:hypothetical protein